MRIGIDARSLLEPRITGVSWYTKRIIEELQKYPEHECVLLKNSWKETRIPNKILNASLRLMGRPYLENRVGGCDIFLCPNLNFFSFSSYQKFVIVVHDLSFERYPELYSRKMQLWHKTIQPRKWLERAHGIIAVSQNTKNDLQEIYHIPKEKIRVIYPGIDVPMQGSLSESRLNQKNIFGDYILTVSTLEPRKNIETLILAFQKANISGVKLLIAGGEGWKTKEIHRLAEGDSRIQFLGYVSEEEKQRLYRHARAFAYVSFYEGFGFPPLEALAYGLPVIASLNSSLPEVLGHEAVYVDPYNVSEVAAALQLVLQEGYNPYKGEMVKRFSWKHCGEEIRDFLIHL